MSDKDKLEEVTIPNLGDMKVQHVDGVKFACHVCGLTVQTGSEENGRQSIFHKMPMCDRFRDSDPLEFLHDARVYYENRN